MFFTRCSSSARSMSLRRSAWTPSVTSTAEGTISVTLPVSSVFGTSWKSMTSISLPAARIGTSYRNVSPFAARVTACLSRSCDSSLNDHHQQSQNFRPITSSRVNPPASGRPR